MGIILIGLFDTVLFAYGSKMNRRKLIKRIIIFILVSVSMTAILFFVEKYYLKERMVKTVLMGRAMSAQIEERLNHEIGITEFFEILMETDHEKTIEKFDEVAERLISTAPELNSIQLAPNGVVTYIYPYSGNEQGLVDLFADADRRSDAVKARDSKKIVITGPVALKQGGTGLIARNPIYIGDKFWGFAIAIVKMDDFWEALPEFADISERFVCNIHATENGVSKLIYSNGTVSEKKLKATSDMELVDGTVWTMELYPKGGWIGVMRRFFTTSFLIFLIATIYMLVIKTDNVLMDAHSNARKASYDALTGVFNKGEFEKKLQLLEKEEQESGFIYMDIDYFKYINDNYGHDVGDKVLTAFAKRVMNAVREEDEVYRVGGDEFVVYVPRQISDEMYFIMRERLKNHIEQEFSVDGVEIIMRASIGMASYPGERSNLREAVRLADIRMYKDKNKNHALHKSGASTFYKRGKESV